MNEPDFEQFGLDWREEAPVEEARVFRRLARRASFRGRLFLYADLALGGAIVAAGLGAMILYRAPWTVAASALLIAIVSWYSWRHYRLNGIETLVSRTDRETMLGSAADAVAARLRSSTIGLILLLPSWLAGIAFKGMIDVNGDVRAFVRLFWSSLDDVWPRVAVLALIATALWFGRQNLRLRRELKSIRALQREYVAEARRDGSPPGP